MKDPSIPELWYNKAVAYHYVNEPYLAAQALDKAIKLNSDYKKAKILKAKLVYKPFLTFQIADLTLDAKGQIKILEFGRGLTSGFSGHDTLYKSSRIDRLLMNALEKNMLSQFQSILALVSL